MRGATWEVSEARPFSDVFQSTHPVRGATAGSPVSYRSRLFQSTHPVRGATGMQLSDSVIEQISIHAPREGCDDDLYKD